MVSINRKSEIETQTDEPVNNKRSSILFSRLFSVDSNISTNSRSSAHYEISPVGSEHTVCTKNLLLKILQLVVAIACVCLYSNVLDIMKISVMSITFPNIVFSASIIITSVIILSHILGYVILSVTVRIFNTILLTLYFTSGCITGYVWYSTARFQRDVSNLDVSLLLLIQTVLSFVNFLLYGGDVLSSIKIAIEAPRIRMYT